MNWSLTATPDQAQYRPGAPVSLSVQVQGEAGERVHLRMAISERAICLAEFTQAVVLDVGGGAAATFTWQPPAAAADWRAYGADLTLTSGNGKVLAEASTAFDVAPHWQVAPRYGFLSDFAPATAAATGATAATSAPEAAAELAAKDTAALDRMLELHLSCVQFYDWMYTHYEYLPPTTVFTDPLGRRLDFGRVESKLQLCLDRGMAPIAYAAVYGGEKKIAEAHPDWLLYDGTGEPMSLAELFYIQDPSPESGWRAHILGEYQAALEAGFVGLHCDTYGSPRAGVAHRPDGSTPVVKLDEVLPSLVEQADALARARDPQGAAIFNCVGVWPLEAMAGTTSAPQYIEVWPPNSTYRDLYEVVMRARRLNPARQVILAAYLLPYHPERERAAGRLAGLRLASAAIFASGGFHLLPGEGAAVLTEGYYPKYGRLDAAEWATVRAYWDFQTRYGPVLADPRAIDDTNTHCVFSRECRVTGAATSAHALPGTVWMVLKEGPGYKALHLINLLGVTNPDWNSPQPEPPVTTGLTARLEVLAAPRAVWAASPDLDGGKPQPVPFRLEREPGIGLVLVAELPALATWTMLVVED